MNFTVRTLTRNPVLQEMMVNENETGTIDELESVELAKKMMIAADESFKHWEFGFWRAFYRF